MKNLYLICLIVLSCQNPNQEILLKNEMLKNENELLKTRVETLRQSVPNTLNKNTEAITALLDLSTKAIISDTLIRLVCKDLVYDTLGDKNSTDYQFLYAFSELANPNRNNISTQVDIKDVVEKPSSYIYLHYLFKQIDRNPNRLKALFNSHKLVIYSLLQQEDYYESSGLKNTVELLLASHQDIHLKTDLLGKLYKRTESVGVLNDTIYINIQSKEVRRIISKFRDHDFVSYTNWAYSFWVRRHHEKNSEIVFEILKEFKKEMDSYNFEQEYFEEDF